MSLNSNYSVIAFFFLCIATEFSKCRDYLSQPLDHHNNSNLIEFIDENNKVHYIDLSAPVDQWLYMDMLLTSRRFHPDNVNFWLYTRDNKKVFAPEEKWEDFFNPHRALVVITHGWQCNGYSKSTQVIKDAFLAKYDVNVIIVNWENKASNRNYVKSAISTLLIADNVRRLIISLAVLYGIEGQNIHLIGHSLGAHVVGLAGMRLRKKHNFIVGRVTGLDPARPFFELPEALPAITSDAAAFVDILHTNSGVLGYVSSIGHADFYPNGGLKQPHCCTNRKSWSSCAHACAYVYFAETVRGTRYKARRCRSYKKYLLGLCFANEIQLMGLRTSPRAYGRYYT